MRRRLPGGLLVALLLAALLPPSTAAAHGFGERYDLPVPLNLYVGGAAAAVTASFVAVSVFVRGRTVRDYPTFDLLRTAVGRGLAHSWVVRAAQAAGVIAFALYLASGLWGSPDATRNLAVVLTWVAFWVGLVYCVAFLGNLWPVLNPWRTLFGWMEALYGSLTGQRLARNAPYPASLGQWPAAGLFLVFAWVEVVDPQSSIPARLASLALAYSAVTFAGMWWFGRDTWLRHGEVFSVVLELFARFAPMEVRCRLEDGSWSEPNDLAAYGRASPQHRRWLLRPWGSGLIGRGGPLSLSGAVLVVLMLATVSFDGFAETPAWERVAAELRGALAFLGVHAFTGVKTVGLIGGAVLFLSVFLLVAHAMRTLGGPPAAGNPNTAGWLLRTFAPSLLPIALAYHVAHFFSFLLIQGQLLLPIAADPFALGWDLFGTAGYRPDIRVVNARFIWFLSVVAIVVGHGIAVFAAHVQAVRLYARRRAALASQLPMLALMVGYTMVSLWIVAQPIVAHG